MAGLVLVTPPAFEPVTLDEAKLHLKQDGTTADDALITELVVAAREACERLQDRSYVTQVWDLFLDEFPRPYAGRQQPIELPRAPVQTVTSVKYTPLGGAQVTMVAGTDYVASLKDQREGKVWPKAGTWWPQDVLETADAVVVRYDAGFGLAAAVPARIKQLVKRVVAHWYYNRGEVGRIPPDLEQLLTGDYARVLA